MLSITKSDAELVYNLFSQITPLTSNDIEEVTANLKKNTFKKEENILEIGQTETRISIVTKGIVHMYTFIDGEIFTINISLPGMIFNSLDSYIYSYPSNDIQVAVTDVEILYLDKKEADQLMRNNNKFCYVYAKLFERVLSEREQRTLLLQYKSAPKRFNYFMNSITDSQRYLQEVPQKLIAQYIGLSPETFCRIKKQYLTNK